MSHFYPRDTLHSAVFAVVARGCLSIRLSHAGTVSKQLKHFDHLVAPSFYFLTPYVDPQFQGEPRQRRRKIHGGWKNYRAETDNKYAGLMIFVTFLRSRVP